MTTVTFRDETATGTLVSALEVAGAPARMTVRDLIHLRVREEIARRHAHPLVRPTETTTDPDWHRQAAVAERAFLTNGFFLLVGDRQVDSLDEVVDLTTTPDLAFIRLVPLAGG